MRSIVALLLWTPVAHTLFSLATTSEFRRWHATCAMTMSASGVDDLLPDGFVPTPFAYAEELCVTIQALTNLGDGLARVPLNDVKDDTAGWVVMVPFVSPASGHQHCGVPCRQFASLPPCLCTDPTRGTCPMSSDSE